MPLSSSFRHSYWTLAQMVALQKGEFRSFLEDGNTVALRAMVRARGLCAHRVRRMPGNCAACCLWPRVGCFS